AVSLAITSSANPSARAQALSFIATANAVSPGSGMPTGVVQFKDGGANLATPITLINGRAELAISTLPLGAHPITAEYYGDPNFGGGVSIALGQNVNTPSLQVGGIVAAPPVYAGDEIVIQGSGFSDVLGDQEVRVLSDENITTTAQVTSAKTDE